MNTLVRSNSLFDVDRFFEDFDRSFGTPFMTATRATRGPRFDVSRTDEDYIIRGELPGYRATDIEAEFEDGQLVISGRRQWERGEDEHVLVREITQASFQRKFQLRDVDIEGAEASMSQGILTLTVPIAETAQPKRIEVIEVDTS